LQEFEELLDRGVQMIAAIEESRAQKARVPNKTPPPQIEEDLPPDVVAEQQEWEKKQGAA
jgi:hypothetical protein